MLGGVSGGIAAKIQGRNIWTGELKNATISPQVGNLPENIAKEKMLVDPSTETTQEHSVTVDIKDNLEIHPKDYGWPPNNGALTEEKDVVLKKGTIIQRTIPEGYKSGIGDKGSYATRVGTTQEMLSLRPAKYQVPNFYELQVDVTVRQSLVMPWYGEPGMGTQYRFYNTISEMVKNDWIRMINDPLFGK